MSMNGEIGAGGGIGALRNQDARSIPSPFYSGHATNRRAIQRLFHLDGSPVNIDSGWLYVEQFDSIIALARNEGAGGGLFIGYMWDGPDSDDASPDPAQFGIEFARTGIPSSGGGTANLGMGADNAGGSPGVAPGRWARFITTGPVVDGSMYIAGVRRHYYYPGGAQGGYERR